MRLLGATPSLRRKIAFAYLAIVFLIVALSVFAFGELRLLEEKILLGERVAELFDTALEVRRFERNYFLHGHGADLAENARYRARLAELLDRRAADFAVLGTGATRDALKQELAGYRTLMDAYPDAAPAGQEALEARIRAAGQRIVASAEAVVVAERQGVRASLSSFRTVLIVAVAAVALLTIAIGQALARRVVRPLQRIEKGVEAVTRGRRSALSVVGDDREIVAIANAFNGMLRDLDLRQRHLLRSQKLAAMGTMVSGVAHELNNPISNIWTTCQILLEDPALPAHEGEMLRQIGEQSIRARDIVRSLLDFARDRPFAREDIALRELVEQTLRFLKADLPPTLAVDVAIPAGLTVPADRQRLQQALLNLVKNAAQAIGDAAAGGRIAIAAALRGPDAPPPEDPALLPCQGEPCVEITVGDTGHGIAADVLPRIFDPFFTTKDVGKGMGLGLYIVYRVIDEHDGCIGVQSEPGRGTTFTMRLPLAAAEKAAT